MKELSETYEEANFEDAHGEEFATDWITNWAYTDNVENRWIILLGEYGTGKTCLTEVLQYRLICRYHEHPEGKLPMRISLRDFSRQFDARTLLHHFLDHNSLGHIPIEFVFTLIREQRIILLLDGYDEMAQFMNPRERRACLKSLADLSVDGARGILTSRPNYFTQDEELRVFESLYSALSQRTFYVGERDKRYIEEEKAIDSLIEEHILNRYERILRDLTVEQTENLIRRKLEGDARGQRLILNILQRTLRNSKSNDGGRSLSGKPVIIAYLLVD